MLSVAADLAAILARDSGVTVSVGTSPVVTVPADVSPANVYTLPDGTGVAVSEHPVWIVYPIGALGALEPETPITVTGGACAGRYVVDQFMRIGDGSVAQVLAR